MIDIFQPEETQGYIRVSADPRRSGMDDGGEDFILTSKELRKILQTQCHMGDQTVWLTTAQAGFPTTVTEGEIDNTLDSQLRRPTSQCLHPAISDFILKHQEELVTQHRSPSETEARVMELEEEWDTQEPQKETRVRQTEPSEDDTWEPNPLPLMVKHPPRIMTSNTKIQLRPI